MVHVSGIVTETTYAVKGEEIDLKYTILPENATNKSTDFSWSSSETNVELKDNKIYAKNRGNAIVSVISQENEAITGNVNIVIVDPIINISSRKVVGSYDFNTDNAYSGYTADITITSQDINDVGLEVKKGLDVVEGFTATINDNIITIHVADMVEAGNYTITIIGKYKNGDEEVSTVSENFGFEVLDNILVESITANDMIIPINYNGGITYELNPDGVTNSNVSFSGYDDSILSIENGIVTPNDYGITNVTITSQDRGNVSKTISVEVSRPLLSYEITKITGDKDASLSTLYELYDATIEGEFNAVLVDHVEISVISDGDVPAADGYFHLNVVGNKFTLEANKTLTTAGNYTILIDGYDSDNNKIVTGTSENNTFVINETLPVTGINASNFAIELGDSVAPEYSIVPYGAANNNVVLSIASGDDVIEITEDGKVRGIAKGNAELIITSKENGEISKTVTVLVKKAEIDLYNESVTGNYYIDTNKLYENYGGKFVAFYTENDTNVDPEVQVLSASNEVVTEVFDAKLDTIISGGVGVKRVTIDISDSVLPGTYTINLIGKYVDESGKIASKAIDSYELVVYENVLIDSITGDDMYIPLDYDGKIKYTISPDGVVDDGVTFLGYDNSIIDVEDDGTITPKKIGTNEVTIKANDLGQKIGTITVHVTEPLLTFEITSVVGDYYFDNTSIYESESGTIYGTFNPILTDDFDRLILQLDKITKNFRKYRDRKSVV
mgnify:CR=1 FL=1